MLQDDYQDEFQNEDEIITELPCCFICTEDLNFIKSEISSRKKVGVNCEGLEYIIKVWTLNTMYPLTNAIN